MVFKIMGWIIIIMAFIGGMYGDNSKPMVITAVMGLGVALLIAGYGSSIEDKLRK